MYGPRRGQRTCWWQISPRGGWGLGSSTRYWGVYYTTDGQPAGFQGTDMELTEDASGQYFWREPGGDNSYQTWQLGEGWYGYLMEF